MAAGLLAMPLAVQATVPTSTSIEGALSSAGGGPAADGSYNVVFSIYKDASGGTAVYSETASIAVKGGLFTYQLGSKTPLTATVLANLPTAFLGLKIDLDPELPRQPINSTPFALRAGVAEGLDCSGCVAEKALDPAILAAFTKTSALPAVAKSGNYADLVGTPPIPVVSAAGKSGSYLDLTNLPVFATVAKTGSYTDLLNAPVLSAVAKSNKYADLTGLPTLAALGTSCGTGLAVKGLKADGSLDCVAAASGPVDVKNLPADGIDEISNGLVNNQFVDTMNGKAGIPIDDNKPTGTSDTLVFPDIGTAQKLSVNVDISNSDISTIAIQVFDSANPSVTYDLCGVAKDIGTGLAKTPCGQVNAKTLKTSFPSLTVPEKGDLTTWVGKNPKGNWFIKVVDGKYLNNAFDGAINSWGITIQTLSNKKVGIAGNLIVDGQVQVSDDGSACIPAKEGALRHLNSSLQICESSVWVDLQRDTCPGAEIHGVCVASFDAGNPDFLGGSKYCNAIKGADICTDSQTWVLRQTAALWSNGTWTNSFGDNDAGEWSEITSGNGDDHGAGTGWQAPCCYNFTPPRTTDKYIAPAKDAQGVTAGSVRVVYEHHAQNVYWRQAAMFCAGMQADLCDKSQYQVLRDAKITNPGLGYWSSDHGDNDDASYEKGIGPISDNPNLGQHWAFACCASQRKDTTCPAPAVEVSGVCTTKIENSTLAAWPVASRECALLNSHLCSIAQTAVLRSAGKVTSAASWTASFSDNDGGNATVGVGNAGDNHPPSSAYGYACCLN